MSSLAPAPPEKRGLSLIVNTWNISRLRGTSPEGLPTDLLSRNSAAFLIFDQVLCDWSGLRGELKWCGHWLSADIYEWLLGRRLITPIDMNEHLTPDFWTRLHANGIAQQAMDLMDSGLTDIKSNHPPTAIDPRLARLNQEIFLSVEREDSLPYDYQEFHFQPASARTKTARMPTILTSRQRRRSRELSRLARILTKMLPNPELLPPITNPSAQEAMKDNVNLERTELHRVIFGESDHDDFKHFRLDKNTRFPANDGLIDDMTRRLQARENFEKLLAVRESTHDIRWQLQKFVVDIVNGKLSVDDAWAEILAQVYGFETAFHSFFATNRSMAHRAATNRGVGSGIAALELYLSLHSAYPGFSPVGNSITAYQAYDYLSERLGKAEFHQILREVYPLGALNADLFSQFGRGLATPRR